MYTALQLIKDQLKDARTTFEGTAADVQISHLHKHPGGRALPLGSLIAHLVFSEDVIVHGMLQGKSPLYYSASWKGKTGASAPLPAMDDKWSEAHYEWSKSVQIQLPQLLKYAKAVFDDTERYVKTLKDTDLEKEVDLGSWGKKTIANLLYGFIIAHTNSLTGEISALKGINGAKGYPF
jgi:hypothetical protein